MPPPTYARQRFVEVDDGVTCFFSVYYDPTTKTFARMVFNDKKPTDCRPVRSSVRPPRGNMVNPFLLSGAASSAIAAVMHVGCIIFGAPWYRFFGAGDRMVKLSDAGSIVPTIITTAIAVVLAFWSLYALSAAGVIPRLPLIRFVLCSIVGVYLLRGLAGLAIAVVAPGDRGIAFWCWSSAICLSIGTLYLVGAQQVWSQLSRAAAEQFMQAEATSRLGSHLRYASPQVTRKGKQ